ncbi:MAG TPA: hypothetical protein VI386_05200 [Candidatus Sulfotelmatobacter sp.]
MPDRRPQGKCPSEARASKQIGLKLDKSLLAYVAAASATGLIGSTVSAEAKVIYTPVNTRLYDNTFPVDLNNDGSADLSLIASFQVESFYRTELHVRPATGNAVIAGDGGAAALTWGTRIGFKAPFSRSTLFMASRARCHSSYCYSGPWAYSQGRYLGVKFSISGQTHYGWVRLSVERLPATLTGYAYETIPNKPIIAGQTSGPVNVNRIDPIPIPTSSRPFPILALLARGADGLAIWRREDLRP